MILQVRSLWRQQEAVSLSVGVDPGDRPVEDQHVDELVVVGFVEDRLAAQQVDDPRPDV